MNARSPSARRAARARATRSGSLGGGSSPGQLTPFSAAGSAAAPRTSSGSDRPLADPPVRGAAVLGAAALGAAVRVASARSVWLGDVVMATPIPGTYRLSDDTAFILAESAKHGICWAAKWPKPGLEQPGGFRHRRRALPAQYGRSGGLESAGRDYRCDCRTAAREG